jgi:hypothetical protein
MAAIRALGRSTELDRSISAAFVIIQHFLGMDFSDNYIDLSHDRPDPFMRNSFSMEWNDRILYQDRVCALAHYLYLLRHIDGFDALILRFKKRRGDVRAVFFEAMSAAKFKRAGFSIKVITESGVTDQSLI